MSKNNISSLDVADYILKSWPKDKEKLTSMKLQKLVYYSQAWFLAWKKKPLFNEKIFAWVGGPVIRELYNEHRGKFYLDSLPKGNAENLTSDQKKVVNEVISSYGRKSAQWLSDLTHSEDPWKKARKDLRPLERGNTEISTQSMYDYYSTLEGEPV